ncbi:MAG: HAMP domain-containing histidine kinase, partial [Anaerolineae bacterium]|nr:HAMP domain-containing histidine kinase [Anaerolineae bacterium]
PDLVEAGRGEVGTDIRQGHDGVDHLYAAAPILYENQIQGYLILAQLMEPAYNEVRQQWIELGGATLPVIALVIGASLWLSGTISHPVQQLRNSALRMADGALDTRIDGTSQDEVGELARTFNYMAEQLESLMQTQRSFVSNAAHELRTPLMTLKLRAEALEDEALSTAERSQYLQEIQDEIDHMAELVSSLLVLARIDEGRHKHSSPINDTASALMDVARHWRIAANKANLDFEAQIPEDLPSVPLATNDLRLVLDNLLGNAIKYTTEGRVCLAVRQKPDALMLEVKDTGIGFSAEQGAQLFTRFYRSEHTRTQFEGNGLGLSIVQAILEQYGAKITASSGGIGKGATFTVAIPFNAA